MAVVVSAAPGFLLPEETNFSELSVYQANVMCGTVLKLSCCSTQSDAVGVDDKVGRSLSGLSPFTGCSRMSVPACRFFSNNRLSQFFEVWVYFPSRGTKDVIVGALTTLIVKSIHELLDDQCQDEAACCDWSSSSSQGNSTHLYDMGTSGFSGTTLII
ncbi:hypothetical protein BX600DRAFT_439197 [Xylariales sp. PMI_506]|nr:hypothetical protein BX600DRAFT_439197 [Xylariales sp. PMI_506]